MKLVDDLKINKDSSPGQGKVAVDGEWPGFAVFWGVNYGRR
jgi:hypothetical protein